MPVAGAAATMHLMPSTRTLVVGYDGSPAGRDAVHWALRDAGGRDTVIVAAVGAGRALLGGPTAATKEARARLESLWMTDSDLVDCEPELVALTGEPARSLADLADARGADLLVVGHHRGGAHPDVTSRLLHISGRPVVVVP